MITSRYQPDALSGTPAEKAVGLLCEMVDIDHSFMMRGHAQDREKNRIMVQIAALGFDLLEGCEEDAGRWILHHKDDHEASCSLDEPGGLCECKEHTAWLNPSTRESSVRDTHPEAAALRQRFQVRGYP